MSTETFTYDAAGNITDAPDSCFQYDTNNRLVVFNGNNVSYDLDGNMLSNGEQNFTYDSANRLVSADGHTYTYNAEDVRIRNLCECCGDTTYTYDTNCRLSKLLTKTTDGVTTKYVYGRGLIGEAVGNTFKTYHFDCRGSTVAITNATGNITDTFAYDTYGKLISRTGTSEVIFCYNGRDGVVTDDNGLIYMRARYYAPEMKRFINADIVAGQLSNAITLNRFAYANGNPVSFVDPFGLSPDNDKGAVDVDSLLDIIEQLSVNKNNKKVASSMLASTLDQLLSFKNIFKVNFEATIPFFVGINTTGEFSVEVSYGKGGLEISSVVSDQLDILTGITFDVSNISVSINNTGEISIGYTADLDKNNSISASISYIPDVSLSVGYAITTSDNDNNSVSTSIKMTHWNEQQEQKPQEKQEYPNVSKSFGWNLAEKALGVLLIGIALGTDAFGFGFDDPILLPVAGALLTG